MGDRPVKVYINAAEWSYVGRSRDWIEPTQIHPSIKRALAKQINPGEGIAQLEVRFVRWVREDRES